MNISDVHEAPAVTDRLEAIFAYQEELAEKYDGIERRNGIGRGLLPADGTIDHPKVQYVLKDYAWRVVEELGEALAADDSTEHAWEELADGLHFLTEMCLLAGVGPDDLTEKKDLTDYPGDSLDYIWSAGVLNLDARVVTFIADIGMACCALKNKPWKQTHFPTDPVEFRRRLVEAYRAYLNVASSWGMSADDLYSMYFKKSQVNHFRIRSQY